MTEQPGKTLTLTQVAERIGQKKRTLYNMIERGDFDVRPIKGTKPRLWNSKDVDEWMTKK